MKILMLGVGQAQVDMARWCRERGHEVIACSYSHGPAEQFASSFELVDIRDVDEVQRVATEHGADVVYSVGSDVAMPTVAAVSANLALPTFVDGQLARTCNDKSLLREALGTSFAGNVPYIKVSSATDIPQDNSLWPAMLKPVDAQGQRGVRRVGDRDEAIHHLAQALSASRAGAAILERYINGPEVSVNGYVVEGRLAFAIVSDRIVWSELHGGLVRGHALPARYVTDSGAAATDLLSRLTTRLEIQNGPVYAQIKVDQAGPWLIEATPRLDGCHMWRAIREHTGVDLLDITLRHLLSHQVPGEDAFESVAGPESTHLEFMCAPPGVPFDRSEHAASSEPAIEVWYYDDEETVGAVNGTMEKCGYRIRTTPVAAAHADGTTG